jgi:hypothetical protein
MISYTNEADTFSLMTQRIPHEAEADGASRVDELILYVELTFLLQIRRFFLM